MSDLRALVQDLRAEAHRAPADIARLMRRAADALDYRVTRNVEIDLSSLRDFDPTPAPIGPPDVLETYEQGAEACS